MKKRNRILIYILTLIMIVCSVIPTTVYAEDYTPIDTRNPNEPDGTTDEALENAQNMDVQSNSWENWPEGPTTNGEAAIIMDADSGAILYAKNIDGYAYPASITKVLTTLIALENAELTDTVTVTEDSLSCLGNGYANIGLKEEEELSLEDTLYAVLLASANEAAHAVGASVGGGYDWFLNEMNQRAKELGAVNSNFVNTNGVHEEDHYTTARDMALITQELFNNHPEFETISQTLQYTIGETNLTDETRTFQQVHKMFYEGSEYYDSRVVAGKTGYTTNAKNTLVTCTDDGNLRLIVVVLKTYGQNVYKDTTELINYAYDNFEKIEITSENITEEVKNLKAGSHIVVPKGVTLEDISSELVNNGDGTGKVNYTYNGENVGTVEVTLEVEKTVQNEDIKEQKQQKAINGFSIIKIIVIIFIVIALLFVILLIVLLIYREKKRAERRRRREARRRRYMREHD